MPFKRTYFYCFLFLIAAARRITEFHEVIIIGAGISGLRASQILQQKGVPHIILESKKHIGGRIAPMHFEGEIVDIGSSFFSSQWRDSSFLKAINKLKWPTTIFRSDYINNYFSENYIEIKQDEMMEIEIFQQNVAKNITRSRTTSKGDLSVNKALQEMQDNVYKQPYSYQCMLQHQLRATAELRGADLNHLSAKHFAFQNKHAHMYPVGGLHKLLQKMFRPQMDNIHFNKKVESIEYFNKYVTIRTNKQNYMAKQVICSVPIGVLKAEGVKFIPSLPGNYQQAINGIGNGISNKLLVSFGKRFWGNRKGWLHFIEPNGQSFPIAFVHPNSNKNILIYYLSKQYSLELGILTPKEIKQELRKSLLTFIDQTDIDIQKVMLTKWHNDDDFLGSFSYYQVGTKKEYFQQLGRAIDKKLWLVGQHTNSVEQGSVNRAYSSGERAALEIVELYKVKVFLQFIPAFGNDRTKVYEKKISQSQLGQLIKQQQFKSID